MSDGDKKDGALTRLLSEIISLIPKDMRDAIGGIVGVYLFVFAPMIIIGGAAWLINMFQEPRTPDTHCWQIQKVGERVIKLNTCTGEAIDLPPPPPSGVQSK